MKLILILLLMSSQVWATQINFSRLSVAPDFDLKFVITHDVEHQQYAILDCQSFIQKMDLFDEAGNLISENPISINECEYLFDQFITCFDKKQDKCIDTKDLFRDGCLCD